MVKNCSSKKKNVMKPAIPYSSFKRLTREINNKNNTTDKAVKVLHAVSEDYLADVFTNAAFVSMVAKRKTVYAKDFLAATYIMNGSVEKETVEKILDGDLDYSLEDEEDVEDFENESNESESESEIDSVRCTETESEFDA